jgi:hypothetical protein
MAVIRGASFLFPESVGRKNGLSLVYTELRIYVQSEQFEKLFTDMLQYKIVVLPISLRRCYTRSLP